MLRPLKLRPGRTLRVIKSSAQGWPFAAQFPRVVNFTALQARRLPGGVFPLIYEELLVDSVPDATREAIPATHINC